MSSAADDVRMTYMPADDMRMTCMPADDMPDDVRTTRGRRADDMCMTPGVVLHEIGQLRQVFAWVSAINLTSNNRRSGKSDKRKPSWTALHKADWLTCWLFMHLKYDEQIFLVKSTSATRGKYRVGAMKLF